jgi:hypothetical protein
VTERASRGTSFSPGSVTYFGPGNVTYLGPGSVTYFGPGNVTYLGSGASGVLVKNDQMICEALGVFPTGGGKLWPPVL